MLDAISIIVSVGMGTWFGWLLCANFQKRKQFHSITSKLNLIMTKEEELQAAIDELNSAATAIAAKINGIIAAEADNVSEESLTALKSVADQLQALGQPTP